MPACQGDTIDPADDATQSPRRRLLSFFAGPVTALLFYLLPIPALTGAAHTLATILIWVVLYWIMEPIPLPVTALLGTAFCVLAGLGTAKTLFASYGHPIIFLFIGSFLLAEAMAVHGIDRKVAAWMLSSSWVGTRPSRILIALGAATAIISMWISNTAATAMMLPIGLGILSTLRESGERSTRYQAGLLLMLSYAATAGGVATVVGTPPNLIGVGLIAQQTGTVISFVTWMAFGLPLAVMMLLCAWLLLGRLHPGPPANPAAHETSPRRPLTMERWSPGEINACVAFGTAVLLWVGPGLLGAAAGQHHPVVIWLDRHLPNELVALLAAGLLFVLPIDRHFSRFTLTWKQASNINWGIILLFGGGLVFGELMLKTGLSDAIGKGFVDLFGKPTLWSLTAVSIVAGVLISELASNTASASMLVPLVIAIAEADGVPALPPALGATLGASLGFALPVSTPPNAIVYGTSLIPMATMIRAGLAFDFVGAVLIWLILRVVCPLIGLV
jgi:sodium-dependent dicarboxylate transporter 2/3/5